MTPQRGCVCRTGELPTTSCPRHGLYGDIKHPPMNRHAHAGETAAQAQRRLYLEAAADRVRIEAAGFVYPLRPLPPRGLSQR